MFINIVFVVLVLIIIVQFMTIRLKNRQIADRSQDDLKYHEERMAVIEKHFDENKEQLQRYLDRLVKVLPQDKFSKMKLDFLDDDTIPSIEKVRETEPVTDETYLIKSIFIAFWNGLLHLRQAVYDNSQEFCTWEKLPSIDFKITCEDDDITLTYVDPEDEYGPVIIRIPFSIKQ